MKKSFFYLTILAGMLFLSVTTRAQQARQTDASPKPPETKGKILQADKVVEPVVSPANAEKPSLTGADPKPSQAPPKLTKGNEQEQAKGNQTNTQPTSIVPMRTDNLVVPKNRQPESKSPAPSAKVNQ